MNFKVRLAVEINTTADNSDLLGKEVSEWVLERLERSIPIGDSLDVCVQSVTETAIIDRAGNLWCMACGGDFLRDDDDRIYCFDCNRYGYEAHFTGGYVCFTCGHLCDCGESDLDA